MANREQLERWAAEHPTALRTGKVLEYPFFKVIMPRVALVFVGAGVMMWANQTFLWSKKPLTLDPEWIAESKRVGQVRQRVNGPPVFSNPFRNGLPGHILGPEDLEEAE